MSSPRNIKGQVREAARIVLREITAGLHNSSRPQNSRSKNGNEKMASPKPADHEVKVRFTREFADVKPTTYHSTLESLSSVSSFQSLSSDKIVHDLPLHDSETASSSSFLNPRNSDVVTLTSPYADSTHHVDQDKLFKMVSNNNLDLSPDEIFHSLSDDPLAVKAPRNPKSTVSKGKHISDALNIKEIAITPTQEADYHEIDKIRSTSIDGLNSSNANTAVVTPKIVNEDKVSQNTNDTSLRTLIDASELKLISDLEPCIVDSLEILKDVLDEDALLQLQKQVDEIVPENDLQKTVDILNGETNDLPQSNSSLTRMNTLQAELKIKKKECLDTDIGVVHIHDVSIGDGDELNLDDISVVIQENVVEHRNNNLSTASNKDAKNFEEKSKYTTPLQNSYRSLSSIIKDNCNEQTDGMYKSIESYENNICESPAMELSHTKECFDKYRLEGMHLPNVNIERKQDVKENVNEINIPHSASSICNTNENISQLADDMYLPDVHIEKGQFTCLSSTVIKNFDKFIEDKYEPENNIENGETVESQTNEITMFHNTITRSSPNAKEDMEKYMRNEHLSDVNIEEDVSIPEINVEDGQPNEQKLNETITLEAIPITLSSLLHENFGKPVQDMQLPNTDTEIRQVIEEDLIEVALQNAPTSLSTATAEDNLDKYLENTQSPDVDIKQNQFITQNIDRTVILEDASVSLSYLKESFDKLTEEVNLSNVKNEQFTVLKLDETLQDVPVSLSSSMKKNLDEHTDDTNLHDASMISQGFIEMNVNKNCLLQGVTPSLSSTVKVELNNYTQNGDFCNVKFQDVGSIENNSNESVALPSGSISLSAITKENGNEFTVDMSLTDVNIKDKQDLQKNSNETMTLQDVIKNSYTKSKQWQNIDLTSANDKRVPQNFKSRTDVNNDIVKSFVKSAECTDNLASTIPKISQDSTNINALAQSNVTDEGYCRSEYAPVNVDHLVSDTNVLLQKDNQFITENKNQKGKTSVPNVSVPRHNPVMIAINKQRFYNPNPEDVKHESISEQQIDSAQIAIPMSNIKLYEDLQLACSTVSQLQKELNKRKKESETELEEERERNNKIQLQLDQEIETKKQLLALLGEYESFKTLDGNIKTDQTTVELEKIKLQEELHVMQQHLSNAEAAFNDVHQKYEKMKGVVSIYRNNETVLRESIQANDETIKALENRYNQLKHHAINQLEKANIELAGIRKQNGTETIKLHAMLKKAELKSKSLTELVEQKTKENKELMQILDELIVKVGYQIDK